MWRKGSPLLSAGGAAVDTATTLHGPLPTQQLHKPGVNSGWCQPEAGAGSRALGWQVLEPREKAPHCGDTQQSPATKADSETAVSTIRGDQDMAHEHIHLLMINR